MSDTTNTADPSKIASRALELYIGRHDVPLNLMDHMPVQREYDQKLVDDICSKFGDDMTIESRKLWPMRVILCSTDKDAIKAISDRGDLSHFKFRFIVVDGQHRLRAALKFLEEARHNESPPSTLEYLSWNCEVYRHELLAEPGLATLSVSYNSPGPSKKALAIDYLIAFTRLDGIQGEEGRNLFNRPKLSQLLISLHKSPTWAPLYNWATHAFNKWISYEVLEGWGRYVTEGEVLRLICEDSLNQIHRLEAIKIEPSPLTTADISKEGWVKNTRHKTGTREAIDRHFKGRIASGIPFLLPGGKRMTTFNEFWSYATEVECIYGPVLWIPSDLDLRPKDKNRTLSIGSKLVPKMRRALSLLSVFLFGTEFTINLKSDFPWWAAFSKKADVEYQWDQCVEVLRMLAKAEVGGEVTDTPPHVLVAEIGMEAFMQRLVWSDETITAWDQILISCEKSLKVPRNDRAWELILQRQEGTLQTVQETMNKMTPRMIAMLEKKLKEGERRAKEKAKNEAEHAERSEKIRIRLGLLSVTTPVGSAVPTTSSPLSKEKQKERPREEPEIIGERSRKRVKYSADGARSMRPEISTSRSHSSSSPQRMPSGSGVGRTSQPLSSVPSERSGSPPDTSEPATGPDSGPDLMFMSDVGGGIAGTRENIESEVESPGPMDVTGHILTRDDDEDEGEDEVETQHAMGARKDSTPELSDAMNLDSQGEGGDTEQTKERRVWCLVHGEIPPPDIPADPVPDPKKVYLRDMVRGLVGIESLVDDLNALNPTEEDLRHTLRILQLAEENIRRTTQRLSTTGREENQMQED